MSALRSRLGCVGQLGVEMKGESFRSKKRLPGTDSSLFDGLIRIADRVDAIPTPLFGALLVLIAWLVARTELSITLALAAFIFGDWLLLALLPVARRSFGPAKPPTLLLAVLRLPPALLPLPWLIGLEALGTVLVVYGFWFEPQRLTLSRPVLKTKKLEAGTAPFRILHLGDLHIERETARERRLVARVRELAPDLILFSGDILNLSCVDDSVSRSHAHSILCNLHAPLGVFAVAGSPPVDRSDVVAEVLRDTGIRWLRGERTTISLGESAIDLIGMDCSHNPALDGPRLAALVDPSSHRFTVLIYHSPDLAPDAAALDSIDLQLSGHTHGGQVRLPFFGALYASSLYGRRFQAGRYKIGAMTLYVTRGLGLEGKGAPRIRFLCPPEIILWEIEGTGSR